MNSTVALRSGVEQRSGSWDEATIYRSSKAESVAMPTLPPLLI